MPENREASITTFQFLKRCWHILNVPQEIFNYMSYIQRSDMKSMCKQVSQNRNKEIHSNILEAIRKRMQFCVKLKQNI